MKNTMNSRNIAKFHKLLKADMKPAEISRQLKVEVDTLKLFTPEALKKAKAAKVEKVAAKPEGK